MTLRSIGRLLALACALAWPLQAFADVAILDGNGNPQTLSATADGSGHQHYNDVDQIIVGGEPLSISSANPLPVTPADQVQATQTITAQDTVSTSSAVQGGQVWWIGTPSAGSVATYTLDGVEQGSVTISGTWTGTLVFETTRDGVHWTPRVLHPDSAATSLSSVTANVQGDIKLAGEAGFRVRATSTITGSAAVTLVESSNPVRIDADLVGLSGIAQAANQPALNGDGGALSHITNFPTTGLDSGSTVGLGVGPELEDDNGGTFASLPALADLRDRQVSVAGAQMQKVYDLRNLRTSLAIYATCPAGTATLEVDASPDDSNWTTIDSLAAASPQLKLYTGTTVGATTALSPLSFRWARVTVGACGGGISSTTLVAAK